MCIVLLYSYCDMLLLNYTTKIEAYAIGLKRKKFIHAVLKYILCMIPIASVNGLLKYCLDELKLLLRIRLVSLIYL